jgi:hypothetical protein
MANVVGIQQREEKEVVLLSLVEGEVDLQTQGNKYGEVALGAIQSNPIQRQHVEQNGPEGIALVESEAGVDNHGDPEGGEEDKEGNVPALAVVANDASSGALLIGGEGGGVPTNDGAEGASAQRHFPAPAAAAAAAACGFGVGGGEGKASLHFTSVSDCANPSSSVKK